MFKNLRLGMKLGLGFGLLIVIMLGLGAVSLINMNRVSSDSEHLGNDLVPEWSMAGAVSNLQYQAGYFLNLYIMCLVRGLALPVFIFKSRKSSLGKISAGVPRLRYNGFNKWVMLPIVTVQGPSMVMLPKPSFGLTVFVAVELEKAFSEAEVSWPGDNYHECGMLIFAWMISLKGQGYKSDKPVTWSRIDQSVFMRYQNIQPDNLINPTTTLIRASRGLALPAPT